MTGDRRKFSCLTEMKGGKVIFGDNNKGLILGKGTIGHYSDPIFHNVLLVQNLKHNLLSISQLCGVSNRVIFESQFCRIERISVCKVLFTGVRKKNIYVIDMKNTHAFQEKCFSALNSSPELIWHRKLGHISTSRIPLENLFEDFPLLNSQKTTFVKHVLEENKLKPFSNQFLPFPLLFLWSFYI
ncbi:hypothetical protein LINPERPRIM_LOCUS31524 [Linum perenne]